MWKNEAFDEIIELILSHHLGRAINKLENFLLAGKNFQSEREQLASISSDYKLMAEYWSKGFDDPERQQVYERLLRRLYVLTMNVSIHDRIRNTAYLQAVYTQARLSRQDWTMASLRADLEDFVSEVAMLELEPEHLRKQKRELVYERHQRLMNSLFEYICTSRLWKDSLAQAFEDILLSPTIDPFDQQLIVSAITISAINDFGFNKFQLLTRIYEKTTDEQLRQRALVGWVFCADAQRENVYPEMRSIVTRLCKDERCREELSELQMQLFYCKQADNDTQTIKNEIMPNLMEANHIKITRSGIVEQDEEQMEDILHPDAAEEKMERMEASMHKMANMQKEGSDIYYAGFSQMKRFPFFSQLSNWFVPFYSQHPGISTIWNNARGQKFLRIIMQYGAFCDSDKYSFVLAFEQVLNHLPAKMLDMIEKGEASPMPVGGEVSLEDQQKPAFMRRLYLQNLYRFFRLFPQRSEFVNPFEDIKRYIFFSNTLFHGTDLENEMLHVASFFMKRRQAKETLAVLDNMSEQQHTPQYCLMMGHLLANMHADPLRSPIDYYRKALQQDPDNVKAWRGYARSMFEEKQYRLALDSYNKVLACSPDDRAVQLNVAICHVSLKQYEEALKQLYKLNYLFPDDDDVNRVLAWALTLAGKYEQATKLYNRLLALEHPQATDLLNYGYCLWFMGDVVSAVSMMRQFLSDQQNEKFSVEHELMVTEHDLIREHGISEVEILLMVDYLTQ